eukprot:TRINITY_DN5473_c0_g1_i3.p1 TRINITY_DN5473_c0_g1~~TRINITY_DN5473_c0_g1_i3.p1  ORF type:complete len:433 (+),score=93.38 TRINITY_DN5473_c0_g1_i3:116-1414(+)
MMNSFLGSSAKYATHPNKCGFVRHVGSQVAPGQGTNTHSGILRKPIILSPSVGKIFPPSVINASRTYASRPFSIPQSLKHVLGRIRNARWTEVHPHTPGDHHDFDSATSHRSTLELMGRLQDFHIEAETSDKPETILGPDITLQGVVRAIKEGKCSNIIVMSGAGISVGAGIPDFRSPGTGLYDNLQKYNLPYPTAVFELDYFQKKPEPFYLLAKELWPGNFKPTLVHYFIRLLAEKGVLLRNYTQNIDTLERVAEIDPEKLVEAHGSFASAHCTACLKAVPIEDIKEATFANKIPTCDCNGILKPDITFFGEALPSRFFEKSVVDFPKCDLLIIIGTSLQVQPFAGLISKVPPTTPRLFINNEKVSMYSPLDFFGPSGGFRFETPFNYRDVGAIGDCQEIILLMADLLGWRKELLRMKQVGDARVRQKMDL